MKNSHVEIIGTVALLKPCTFTQYSEHAAWTDYVRCEQQEVELRLVDNYWVCASFDGVLETTTFPPGSRLTGSEQKAFCQWSKFGALAQVSGSLFDVRLNEGYRFAKAGTYGDGCGESTGKDILFLEAVKEAD